MWRSGYCDFYARKSISYYLGGEHYEKVLALILAMVFALSLAACGNKVPEGTYKMIYDSKYGELMLDITTLEVKSDGTATYSIAGKYGDSWEVKFDTNKRIATYNEAKPKYSVDGNKITFTYADDSVEVFEKQ